MKKNKTQLQYKHMGYMCGVWAKRFLDKAPVIDSVLGSMCIATLGGLIVMHDLLHAGCKLSLVAKQDLKTPR